MHDSAELDGNILGQARAKNAQAAIYLELDNNYQAIAAAVDAEQLARLTGADMELALAQLVQGEAAGRMGDRARAVNAGRQAIERGRSLDAPQGTARALALLATFADEAEARRRAVDELQALAEDLKRDGLDEAAAYALGKLGALWLALDQPQRAREALERALAWQRSAKAPRVTAEVLRLAGIAACRTNDAGSAIGLLEEAEALADAAGDRYQRLACRLAVGESLLARGQYLAAEATLRQVIAAAEDRQRLGSWVHLGQAYALLIEVLTRQGRLDEARLVAAGK
jgi:tetratricopeptide (TPR) repeat protein